LHGLDWAGDPLVSVPCAQRQLERIDALARAGGLSLTAAIGDPDVLAAISDAAAGAPADELVLFWPPRRVRLSHPLDLSQRARRLTGVPVERVEVPLAGAAHERRPRMRLRHGHCTANAVA
jgi:hypothetical protein